MTIYLAVYLAGVAIALAVMRDPLPSRVGTALVWPLGPIAFVVVVGILLLAALALWPVLMLTVAALIGTIVWLIT